ncbi:MAG: CDP-glycerol glycerophosphotransferase family protein [Coriobacteriales bacterium]
MGVVKTVQLGMKNRAKAAEEQRRADEERRHAEAVEREFREIHDAQGDPELLEPIVERIEREYREIYEARAFAKQGDKYEKSKAMARALELEQQADLIEGLRKKIVRECKAHYIKELIPEAYAREVSKPIENKLIFMENGNCPSPSNSHLISVLKKMGTYTIHKTGLKRRRVSELEYYENALAFAADAATAKTVFISSANDVFSHVEMRPETKLIQLWHGVGMFKRVGWSTVDKSFGKGVEERREYDQYRNYTYVTIAGKAQAWTFEDAMHIPADSGVIVPVGVARTDVFYDPHFVATARERLLAHFPQIGDRKLILYAPTFRGDVGNGKAPDQLDIDKLGQALSDEYVLLIKYHNLSKDIPPIPQRWEETFAFNMNKNSILSIERLLSIADICITDYSSIGFEYAIMERPLIFFAYDLDEYLDTRGMYYDYDEVTPGPICKTNEEMIDYIQHIDERFDKQQVIDFKKKYVGACDGHATERTIALIES